MTRDELRQALWPADTFLEFDTALNIVVTKVRHALADVAVSPRFIETVPKRGYRFIADVHQADETTGPRLPDVESESWRNPGSLIGWIGPPATRTRPVSAAPVATRWLAAALLLAGVIAATSRFWRLDWMPRPAEPAVMQLEVSLGPDVSLRSAPGPSVAISANGERLVFVSNGRLMTRRLDHLSSTCSRGHGGSDELFLLPTANRWRRRTRQAPTARPRWHVGHDSGRRPGRAWRQLGRRRHHGARRYLGGPDAGDVQGRARRTAHAAQPNEFTHRWPQFLPGGRAVVFTSHTAPTWWSRGRVEALSLADGRRKLFRNAPPSAGSSPTRTATAT